MASSPATPVWDLRGPYGMERWIGEPGQYSQVLLNNEPLSLDPRDGELQFLRARGSACIHPGPWPYEFHFCPHCGLGLPLPPPAKAAESWSSLGNASTGLPTESAHGTPDATRRGEMPMPGPSRLDFVVAGTPARLLALDQTTMALYVWKDASSGSFTENCWSTLAQLPDTANLPRWSWSAAATGHGLVLPMDDGPVWLVLRPRGVQRVIPDGALKVEKSLGGAVTVDGRTLVPVLAKGALAIAAWIPDETRWDVSWVEDPLAGSQIFAAPSANASGAFWVGTDGQLFARWESGKLRCAYRPWRAGWVPMSAVRPVLSPNGVFHQLGREGRAQSFEALLLPGNTPENRSFDRFIISCGEASFGGMIRYREPWAEKRMEYLDRAGGGFFMAPLLAFAGNRHFVAACSPRQALLPFIEIQSEQAELVECRMMLAGSSRVPDDLALTFKVRHIWDLTPFIYGNALFIYEAVGNRCFYWPLKDFDAA